MNTYRFKVNQIVSTRHLESNRTHYLLILDLCEDLGSDTYVVWDIQNGRKMHGYDLAPLSVYEDRILNEIPDRPSNN